MRPSGLPKTGGRKKNSSNIVGRGLKEKLSYFCEKNFKSFENDLRLIERPEDRCKLFIEMFKMIVPKPSPIEEQNNGNEFRKVFLERIFPKKE